MLQAERTQWRITIGGELAKSDVVAKGVSPGLGGRRRERRWGGGFFRGRERRRLKDENRR